MGLLSFGALMAPVFRLNNDKYREREKLAALLVAAPVGKQTRRQLGSCVFHHQVFGSMALLVTLVSHLSATAAIKQTARAPFAVI